MPKQHTPPPIQKEDLYKDIYKYFNPWELLFSINYLYWTMFSIFVLMSLFLLRFLVYHGLHARMMCSPESPHGIVFKKNAKKWN
jgi:hypothetical protein